MSRVAESECDTNTLFLSQYATRDYRECGIPRNSLAPTEALSRGILPNSYSVQEMLEIREHPSPISLHHSCFVVSHPLITDTRSSSSCFPFQIKLLAKGNQRDENDFTEREKSELNQFNDGLRMKTDRISMAPPVNRQNELASRANYYQTFARENFDGHWNLLGAHGFHIGDEGSRCFS